MSKTPPTWQMIAHNMLVIGAILVIASLLSMSVAMALHNELGLVLSIAIAAGVIFGGQHLAIRREWLRGD